MLARRLLYPVLIGGRQGGVMGTLVYVVGPSGAGKDSVMRHARQRCPGDWPVLFAHRYITRPVDPDGENHVVLSRQEFCLRRDLGLFCLHWESHDNAYGIGLEVEAWLERGLVVVMNGSRGYLDTAVRRFPGLVPVLIRVAPATLRQRLEGRGRETPEAIDRRLERARRFTVDHPAAVHIDNSGPLDQAGTRLLALIRLKTAEQRRSRRPVHQASAGARDSSGWPDAAPATPEPGSASTG
ncbi:MAG: phosphonate metabolism protein/1,5-bisphosphokinase (PRPP-forming) PhnN [Opitutales bacterium]